VDTFFPMIQDNIFHEGSVLKSAHSCRKKYNHTPCKEFYSKIMQDEEGFYICPSGYSVYHKKQNGKSVFYIGIFIKNHFRKRVNTKQHSDEKITVMQTDMFLKLLSEQDCYLASLSTAEQEKELFNDLLHDVKKLDSLVKTKSEKIIYDYGQENDENRELINKIKNILAMEELIACKYAVYDLASNIGALSMGQMRPVEIYKKFDKARYILADYKGRRTNIQFRGETSYAYSINPSYSDILPFLLLENAVKYSVGDREILVSFVEKKDALYVDIKSFGPYCESEELEKIFLKGYRGKNTNRSTDGTGVGLYLSRQICGLCNIDISASSEYEKVIDNVKCGEFCVHLIF